MQDYFLKLDWLGFTYRCPKDPNYAGKLPIDFFLEAFPELKPLFVECVITKIRSHYNVTLVYGSADLYIGFNVLHDGDSPSQVENLFNVGVNVQVPSHFLESFFNIFGFDINDDLVVPDFFKMLIGRGCQLSRLDLNWDDFNYRKTYTAFDYCKAYYNGLIETRFTPQCIGKKNTGCTIYFGSLKKRTKLLRIYDKFAESKGELDVVRYEFEFHSDDARDMASFICNECPAGLDFSKLLFNFFKLHSSDATLYSKIYDSPLDPEWVYFLLTGFKNESDYLTALKASDTKLDIESIVLNVDLTLSSNSPIMPYKVPHYDYEQRKKDLTYFVREQALPSVSGYVQLYGEREFMTLVYDSISKGRVKPEYQREYNKLVHCLEWQFEIKDGIPF